MAIDIAAKQLNDFKLKLAAKKIEIEFSQKCIEHVAKIGTSYEFGAREISRVINGQIKNILVDEILFGKLKDGGKCSVDVADDKFVLNI